MLTGLQGCLTQKTSRGVPWTVWEKLAVQHHTALVVGGAAYLASINRIAAALAFIIIVKVVFGTFASWRIRRVRAHDERRVDIMLGRCKESPLAAYYLANIYCAPVMFYLIGAALSQVGQAHAQQLIISMYSGVALYDFVIYMVYSAAALTLFEVESVPGPLQDL